MTVFRWVWTAAAVVLAGGFVFVGARNTNPTAFASAAMIVAGLALRSRSRETSTALIGVGVLPALLPWWMVFPPILAATVWVGLLLDHRRPRTVPS